MDFTALFEGRFPQSLMHRLGQTNPCMHDAGALDLEHPAALRAAHEEPRSAGNSALVNGVGNWAERICHDALGFKGLDIRSRPLTFRLLPAPSAPLALTRLAQVNSATISTLKLSRCVFECLDEN